jgi:CheY-like chemotaxis protein
MARILFVDDEPSIREEAVQLLRRDGHKVVEATNGREAMRMLETVPIDVVILDVVMPKQDGFETISEIRRLDDEARNVKIITISNGAGARDRATYLNYAQSLGADSVLPKPFSLSELREALTNILGEAPEAAAQ